MRWLLIAILPLWMVTAQANVEALQFDTPQMEERYRHLINELRCLVCQNQNLADSNAELAQDLRRKTYEMITAGKSDEEIVDDMEPKDLADIAADDIDRRILEVLGSQEIKRLQLIDSALGRLENGHYGVCMSCGNKIPPERLKAIPYAILCIDCKWTHRLIEGGYRLCHAKGHLFFIPPCWL